MKSLKTSVGLFATVALLACPLTAFADTEFGAGKKKPVYAIVRR